MRTITKLFVAASMFAAFGSAGMAQATIDNETPGVGGNYTWTGWDGTNVTIVANPSKSGINTSEKVLNFTSGAIADGAKKWCGAYTDNITEFTLTKDNCFVKLMCYKSVSDSVIFKMEKGAVFVEAKALCTKTDEWQELTFDLTAGIGNAVSRIVMWPDWIERDSEDMSYFDNISFGPKPVVSLSSVEANGVSIYPNPTTGAINISASQELAQVVVSNIVGAEVKSISVSGLSSTVNIGELAAGAYFVTVKQANGNISVQKVIKK